MEDITQTEGYKKAKEVANKLKAEKEAEKESDKKVMNETKAMVTTDYSKYANMGMKNITSEDIRPPVMFLVQNIKDRSELVDLNGNQCPDGSFYIKSFNEIIKSIRGYIIWVRKDHFTMGQNSSASDQKWDGSRMYRAIFIRKDTLQPLAITFKKSSLSALNDLFTVSKVKNLPLFLFEVDLKNVVTTNKKGESYFKSVAQVIGQEQNPEVLQKLFSMAQEYDGQEEVEVQDDEVPSQGATLEDAREVFQAEVVEDVSDDVPF